MKNLTESKESGKLFRTRYKEKNIMSDRIIGYYSMKASNLIVEVNEVNFLGNMFYGITYLDRTDIHKTLYDYNLKDTFNTLEELDTYIGELDYA